MLDKLQFGLLVVALPLAQSAGAIDESNNNQNSLADQDIEVIYVQSGYRRTSLAQQTSNVAWLQADEIDELGATHITEALQRIPGTWVSRGNGQEHLTAIRSPVLTGAGGCGAFFIAEDNISLRAAGFCNANQLFGVNSEQAARVEVLRGPNSVLYGSNAVHGVINVLSPDVDAGDYLGIEVGPHQYQRGRFFISHGDSQGGFAAYGNFTHDGGYKEESGFGQEKLSLVYQKQGQDYSVKSVLAYTNLNQETAGFVEGFEAYKDSALKRANPNPEAFRDSRSWRWYARLGVPLANGADLSVTPYLRHHDMTFLQHFIPWQPLEQNQHESAGLKLTWSKQMQSVLVTAGLEAEFTQGEMFQEQDQPFAPHLPAGVHYDYQVDAHQYAPYVQVQGTISEDIGFELGARYDEVVYDYVNNVADGSACADGVENCRYMRPSDQEVDFGQLSYQAGLHWQLAQQQRIFANLRQGFRAPQTTELFRLQAGQLLAELEEERSHAIELGWRGWSADIQWELVAYSQDKDNFIFQDTQRQNVDDGETSHQGVEFTFAWSFAPGWQLNGQLSWSEHKYENDIQLSRGGSILGNSIDTAPKWLANTVLQWQVSETWQSQLEWQFLDEYFLDPGNTASYEGHHLVNWRNSWQLDEHWRLGFRVINLLDRDYAERADFAFGSYRYFVGEPRSVYGSVQYRF